MPYSRLTAHNRQEISGFMAQSGSGPAETAQQLREQIEQATGLTASCGIAPVRFIAKIASDR